MLILIVSLKIVLETVLEIAFSETFLIPCTNSNYILHNISLKIKIYVTCRSKVRSVTYWRTTPSGVCLSMDKGLDVFVDLHLTDDILFYKANQLTSRCQSIINIYKSSISKLTLWTRQNRLSNAMAYIRRSNCWIRVWNAGTVM